MQTTGSQNVMPKNLPAALFLRNTMRYIFWSMSMLMMMWMQNAVDIVYMGIGHKSAMVVDHFQHAARIIVAKRNVSKCPLRYKSVY